MKYIDERINGLSVTVRDIELDDISAIVDYWHNSQPEFLESIGVEISKIISRERTEMNFLAALPANRKKTDRAVLIFSVADKIVGYTNVNFGETSEAYAHVHIMDPKYRNKGIIPTLFFKVIKIYYEKFEVGKLMLQTNVKNVKINNLLFKKNLELVKTEFIEKPDGMGSVGNYNLFYCPRDLAEKETSAC